MKIKPFIASLFLLVGLCALTPLPAVSGKEKKISELPIEIKSGVAQLFVDDFLIETQSNLTRTMHHARFRCFGKSSCLQPLATNRFNAP
ncbi:MAG: hypothetical protein ABI042_04040 [Verrucomicrobiota bacterium]